MAEEVKLKACPFCDGEAKRRPDPGRLNEMFGLVVDHRPGCFMTLKGYEDDAVYDAAWNTHRLAARNAALEEAARVADRHDTGDCVREDMEARRISAAIRALAE